MGYNLQLNLIKAKTFIDANYRVLFEFCKFWKTYISAVLKHFFYSKIVTNE